MLGGTRIRIAFLLHPLIDKTHGNHESSHAIGGETRPEYRLIPIQGSYARIEEIDPGQRNPDQGREEELWEYDPASPDSEVVRHDFLQVEEGRSINGRNLMAPLRSNGPVSANLRTPASPCCYP